MARVLIFSPIYPPKRGGAATYFSNVIKKMDKEHQIIVLTMYDREKRFVSKEGTTKIYRVVPDLHRPPLIVRTAIPSLVAFLFGLFLILINDIDVVHSHSSANAVPGLAVVTTILAVPLIYDCQDENFPLWMVRLGNVAHWFSCSSNIDQRLKEAGVEEDRITRIPVVNPDYVSEYASDAENSMFTIVYIGAVARHKGIFELLDAFDQFQEDQIDVKLVIVGDGPELENIGERIQNWDYSNQIELKGRVSHRAALSELAKGDVLLLLSESEGLPRVVVEAFELGVPVVATPVGGIPDVIIDGQTGLLVNRDIDEIVAALHQLYSSPTLRRKLANNASKRINNWDWETVISRINETYNQVLLTD